MDILEQDTYYIFAEFFASRSDSIAQHFITQLFNPLIHKQYSIELSSFRKSSELILGRAEVEVECARRVGVETRPR